MSKTEYMAVNSSEFPNILNKQMKQMNHFKYLGVWITKEKGIGICKIKNRIEPDQSYLLPDFNMLD
jgi:hypothetical protein